MTVWTPYIGETLPCSQSLKRLIAAVVPCIAAYELISAFSWGVYFWYIPRFVDFAPDSAAEASLVLFSSSATRLLAASMHDDCIVKERGPVGLGKMSFEGFDFLK